MGIVVWSRVEERKPHAKLVLLRIRTPHGVGYRMHSMCSWKTGEIVPWDEQNELWTGGTFEYNDVTHWASLDGADLLR